MILGIGHDLLRPGRIVSASLAGDDPFCRRAYTAAERDQARERGDDYERFLRGRFCAKEAVFKALSFCGEEFHPGEIEILDDKNLHPLVTLSGRTKASFDAFARGPYRVLVSITYEEDLISAFALVES